MRRLAVFFWLATAPPVSGWGVEGHNLVARLAAARLTPRAAIAVAQILGPNTSLASISSWADQVRNARKETGPWHYIDIPIDKPHLEMKRDCPGGNCVLTKIAEFERTVGNSAATPEQRKEALKFLVHFVGDMHQPLHCADNRDKGGNDVKLEFLGRPTNLHSLWDSRLLERMGTEDELFASLDRDLTPKRAKKLAKGKVADWAEQSHRAAQLVVYGNLAKAEVAASIRVGEAYQETANPAIRQQLEEAGARLAKVLNQSLR